MTQRDENVEDEQQTSIEENEISKEEMKDLEHVEDSLHEEANQEVNECLIEQYAKYAKDVQQGKRASRPY